MMTTSWDFARLLNVITEVRRNEAINDNDRIALLREMQAQLPPERMSVLAKNSRAIVDRIITETLNGYTQPQKAPKATAKKSKSSGKGEKALASSEEQLLRNAHVHTRGKSVKKRMVN